MVAITVHAARTLLVPPRMPCHGSDPVARYISTYLRKPREEFSTSFRLRFKQDDGAIEGEALGEVKGGTHDSDSRSSRRLSSFPFMQASHEKQKRHCPPPSSRLRHLVRIAACVSRRPNKVTLQTWRESATATHACNDDMMASGETADSNNPQKMHDANSNYHRKP